MPPPLLCEEGEWRSIAIHSPLHRAPPQLQNSTFQQPVRLERSPATSVENCAALHSIRVCCVLTRFSRHAACYVLHSKITLERLFMNAKVVLWGGGERQSWQR